MNTPKNDKKQFQRQSLSAAKKGPVKGLKNVLMQPQEMKWPILRDESVKEEFHHLLKGLLPVHTRPERIISWAKLRKMSKNERLELKKQAQSEEKPTDPIMSTVIVGVNAVTRALEKGTVCSVLLDSNVDPFFMIKHIVIMGRNKNIPVLLIPFLKAVTAKTIGFPCLAMALKDSDKTPDSHFYKLHQSIAHHVHELPLPKVCAQLFTEDDPADEIIPKKSLKTIDVSSSIYLYRPSPNARAFTPASSASPEITLESSEKAEHLWPEFISLGDDTEMVEVKSKPLKRYVDIHKEKCEKLEENDTKNANSEVNEKKRKSMYLPMKVKRVKGNPNRTKATKISKSTKKQFINKKKINSVK